MVTTFVLVHGSFCNSAAWAPTVRELTLRGHRALAVDLPGHGLGATIPSGYLGTQDPEALATEPSGMAGIGTADDVAAVTEVLRRARANGPVVLVGHSRGGLTLTAVGNAVPELVDRLVYVAAWCCVDATVSEYSAGPENAESLLGDTGLVPLADPAQVGAIRLNWRTGDPDVLDRLQVAVLADGSRTELLAYLHHQEADETISVDEAATRGQAGTWGRIPRTYVRLTADRSVPPALQDRFIAEADALTPDNPTDVRSIDSSHVRFQIHPGEFVEILDELAPAKVTPGRQRVG
ncbi:alpha/beta fold hydrolase [Pseudonocardia cypriaca]|uniref:Pimeloyl-ACP methyl ester carboxylesterase n=1 Tax=Pseudonocardia cypriaca TaxID=882449 RepID=A0A543GBU3_9PSEU|nr:alpha/beta hydrolase [Pseudonocardia cypriaca]TQM43538.1 pimeloyl-ACP methyl ester carboxylesterase [Pseudonocardia cypriaca]